jgi:Amt family ammonium transporter
VHSPRISKLSLALFFVLACARPALAASLVPASVSNPQDLTILAVGLTFLLPMGLMLLMVAAFPREQAIDALTGGVVAWALASVAYFAIGFAFQFGGIAVYHDVPDLKGLYWEYSLLDTTWGTGWGMIGLKGFFLLNEASTPGALSVFLSQLPLLGVAGLILYFALHGRSPRGVILLASLVMGGLIYPLVGNWTWASGWLANLGRNLAQGHGLVDVGGSGQVALLGASAALAALLVYRPKQPGPDSQELQDAAADGADVQGEAQDTSMPPVQLPLLAALGAILMLIGWIGMAFLVHLPTAGQVPPAPAIANLVLAAMGAALTAGLYSWFTTNHLNSLMSARAMVAGLVVAAAGAPFIPAWSALAAGLVVGITLPLLIYFFDRVVWLEDSGAILATFGAPALLGLLLPALVADGRYGVGWNGVGAESFLGVTGQGVSGLLVAPGFAADWPGQAYAQLLGIVAILVWSGVVTWLLLRGLTGLIQAWQRTGLEFGAPPQPVASEDEVLPPREDSLMPREDQTAGAG